MNLDAYGNQLHHVEGNLNNIQMTDTGVGT